MELELAERPSGGQGGSRLEEYDLLEGTDRRRQVNTKHFGIEELRHVILSPL
jgi:hypothetical protein